MQFIGNLVERQIRTTKDDCSCPPIPYPPCPPLCPPTSSIKDSTAKYYQQIGAEMIDNQLIIRMEKKKNKIRKKLSQWDPPCDCNSITEILRPSKNEGPKIIKPGDNNRILFRIHSKGRITTKDDPTYKPQTIAYKVGSCRGGKETNDQCRTITVYPQSSVDAGSQEVHNDRITEGNQNVFLLRIKKKPDSVDFKKRNVELELRTPRPPTPPPVLSTTSCIKSSIQVEKKSSVEKKPLKKKQKKKKTLKL